MRLFLKLLGLAGLGVAFLFTVWDPWAPGPVKPEPPPTIPEATLDPALPQDVAAAVWAAQADFDAKRHRAALDRIIKYADAGYHDVDTLLGRIYLAGGEGIADADKAYRHLTRAVEKDNPIAWYMLGSRLFDGDPFPKDTQRGFALLRKAADCGMPAAHALLGYYALTDKFLNESHEIAKDYLSFAAWAGLPNAQLNLGKLFAQQHSSSANVESNDISSGLQWMILSARNDYHAAKEQLNAIWGLIGKKHGEEILNRTRSIVTLKADRREAQILPADPLVCGFDHPAFRALP